MGPTGRAIVDAMRESPPLSVIMAEQVQRLRARERCVPADQPMRTPALFVLFVAGVAGLTRDVCATPVPVPGPDRIIAPVSFAEVAVNGEGSGAFISGGGQVIDIWALLVAAWPETVAATALLVGLVWMWRLHRHRRLRGEPYCRRCDYRLTGMAATTCPECGRPVTGRGRVVGRRRRWRVIVATGLVVATPLLYAVWLRGLPREGAVSRWRAWWSIELFEWADKHSIKWLTDRAVAGSLILKIDLATGATDRVVYVGPTRASVRGIHVAGNEIFMIRNERDASAPIGYQEYLVGVDMKTGREFYHRPIGTRARVVACDRERRRVSILSGRPETLSIVDLATGETVHVVSAETDRSARNALPNIALALPPDQRRIIATEYAGTAKLHGRDGLFATLITYHLLLLDGPQHEAIAWSDEALTIGAITSSADGRVVYVAVHGEGVWRWNLDEPAGAPLPGAFEPPDTMVTAIAVSPDDRFVFVGRRPIMPGPRQTIGVFSLEEAAWIDEWSLPTTAHILSLGVPGDGRHLVAEILVPSGGKRQLAVFNLE